MQNQPLRIGILGCANIARHFTRDVAASPAVRVVAVASREAAKAENFARDFAIPRAHASYEALLADGEVDAVYIPLPNSLHAEWAIRCAESGRHVLCEKPLAVNAAEAQAMFDAARRNSVMLLEAYPYWFQPQTGDLVALLGQGAIGELRSMQASFGFSLPAAGNIRLDPGLGGGGLLDAGCYPLSLIRLVMGSAPTRVRADATYGPSDVDVSLMATLFWADGRRAQLSCAMDASLHRHAQIVGTRGTIETEYLNHTSATPGDHPWGYVPSRMRVRRVVPGGSLAFEDVVSPAGSGFRFAAEAFAKVVGERDFEAIERAAAASIDIAATLEAIAQSARSGESVTLLRGA
jgi:predicted dehydrogenase